MAGDARYVRGNYQYQQYIPLNKQYTIAFNGELAWGKGLNGQTLPGVQELLSAVAWVRCAVSSRAPWARAMQLTDWSIGGPKKITLNAEVHGAVSRAPATTAPCACSALSTPATSLAQDEKYRPRPTSASSVGVGISWISPIGPLRLAFATPTAASSLAIESRNCNSRLEPLSNEVFFPSNLLAGLLLGLLALRLRAGAGFQDRLCQHWTASSAKPVRPRLRRPSWSRSSPSARKNCSDLGTQLKSAADKFEREAPTLSESQRATRQKQLVEQDRDFQRKRREFQEDLNARKNEELQQVLERANRVVKQVAEAEKYDLILQEAVYINPKHDITDKVIKALNARQVSSSRYRSRVALRLGSIVEALGGDAARRPRRC